MDLQGDASTCFRQIEAFLKKVMQLEQLARMDQVGCLVVLNWAAPSTFSSEHQNLQANLAGAIINQSGRSNIGFVICPSYCRTRGTAHKQEKICAETLASCNLNLDEPFVLPFKGKNDERERRTDCFGLIVIFCFK